MKAFLKNYRQSPRKVRAVAGLIRGKNVDQAIAELSFLAKRASDPMKKLLLSAVANAQANFNIAKENLIVKELRVDKGIVMKRMMPAAMGTGHRINKRTSHIMIVLAEKGGAKNQANHKKNTNAPSTKSVRPVKTEKVLKEKVVKTVSKAKTVKKIVKK